MAYNEKLSQKVQALLLQIPGMKSKQMFGAIGFLLHGHMACGILQDDLTHLIVHLLEFLQTVLIVSDKAKQTLLIKSM
ncbi:MAG: TfoX/Sxy family protein [Desulfobulbaceae bacterium]|nr:TfoX/Sxy family protein [Desulfobulbaceae bacterium]